MLAPTVEAQCLAQLAILEADSGQWIDAGELAAEAMNIVVSLDLVDRPPVAMVFAISALVHARGGAVSAARSEAKRATFLSTMPRDVAPWFAADARLLIARTHLHLGDVAIAPLLLREAQSIASRTPDLDLLLEHIENAQTRARTLRAPLGVVAAPLTPAEMRVLRFLPTHLTFPAIADELFVSRNTVKTQAISIYRKLGVSSRDPAVEAARDLGLLEP